MRHGELVDQARAVLAEVHALETEGSLDVVVRVDVTSFEVDAAGNARLEACWTIRDSRTRTARRDECSSIVEAIDGHGAQAQVAALGRAVSELARQVANAIRS